MKTDTSIENPKLNIDWGLLAALVIPLVALLPLLLHRGLPNTADGPAHLMRQVELNQAWAEGNFYPRWGTDLAFGHGMPIFSYAPPLLYQATQLIHLSGLPLDESMKGVVVLDFLLYSVGMFLFARRIYGPTPALVAAAVYVYAPYRLREAYIQGNYGQFSGLAFYPLIFWAFHGLLTDGRPRYWLAAPLALAGLLFSHNISFMLFAPLFAAYLLFLSLLDATHRHQNTPGNPKIIVNQWLKTIVAGLLGLGLAAIFWLPAFGERHDIKLEGITQGFFDFRENFISLPEFLALPKPLDLSAINPEFPLSLGPAQILAAALGLLAAGIAIKRVSDSASQRFSESATKRISESITQHATRLTAHSSPATRYSPLAHSLFFAAGLGLYAFLALPASQGVWEAVPLLELTEFPWRMLGPAIFCAALLAAAGISVFATRHSPPATRHSSLVIRHWSFVIGHSPFIIILLIIALNLPYLYPSQFIRWDTPAPADAFAYEVTSGAIGTTSTGEFLPRWAQQHPQPNTLWPDYEAGRPPQILDPAGLPPGATAQTTAHRSESAEIRVTSPQPFTATLRVLYWPGWHIYLDGQPAPFEITTPTGLLQTRIPPGEHTLRLQLESTPLRSAGLWLSLAALAGLGLAALIARRQHRAAAPVTHPTERVTGRQTLALAAAIIGLFLLSRPLQPWLVWQSNPDRPRPADHHPAVDFADQLRLVGVDNWPEVIDLPASGEGTLTAVLYWRAQQKLETNYSVFLHLDAPNGQTFATVDEVSPENIPTRNWPPGLYLRNPLTLRLPANLPPIRYTLTTGAYNRATGERLAIAGSGNTAFALGSVWLAAPQPRSAPAAIATIAESISLRQARLDGDTLRLLWRTDQPIERDLSVFVHLLDAQGQLVAQADGVPYNGLYPLPNWRPGQFITDDRPLDVTGRPVAIVIGLYDPATGERLPARNAAGQPLPDNAFTLAVTP